MNVKFDAKVTGIPKFMAHLEANAAAAKKALARALFMEGEELMTAAKKLVPVDTGALRASGHVQLPAEDERGMFVRVGFGGPAGSGNRGESNKVQVGYAVRVHEDLEVFGKSPGGGSRNTGRGAVRKGVKRTFVGQAKYLEVPFNQRKKAMVDRIGRRFMNALKG